MEIIKYDPDGAIKRDCVLALGFFDGVHLGHRELFALARRRADEMNISFGIFTFASGSRIKPDAPRIYGDSEKARLFEELGADFAVFADFDNVAGISAEDFVNEVLVRKLGAAVAVAGFNYRFGRGAAGNAERLKELMAKAGGEALICEEYLLDGRTVSTTRVREALSVGDVKEAARLLGAPYRVGGRVSHGRGEGKRLGFPTLNTSIPEGTISPRRGVYETAVRLGERAYKALTNVGTCPTFEEREVHLETYILDFKGDLYGENISVEFIEFIREEKQFASEKELIMQINVDRNAVLNKNI